MEITIKINSKEIADLVSQLQSQQNANEFIDAIIEKIKSQISLILSCETKFLKSLKFFTSSSPLI